MRVAVRLCVHAWADELEVRRYRGHDRPTGGRVLVLDDDVVVRVALAVTEVIEGRERVAELVDQGLRQRVRLPPGFAQQAVGVRGGERLLHALDVVGLFDDVLVHPADQGRVQAVEPDHRAVAFVAVFVPVHRGGEQEVADLHRDALAVDDRVRALALNDEPEGARRVPVRRGDLAGEHQLHGRPQ
nr:hypothetical protein [Micromonospora eburnea]